MVLDLEIGEPLITNEVSEIITRANKLLAVSHLVMRQGVCELNTGWRAFVSGQTAVSDAVKLSCRESIPFDDWRDFDNGSLGGIIAINIDRLVCRSAGHYFKVPNVRQQNGR